MIARMYMKKGNNMKIEILKLKIVIFKMKNSLNVFDKDCMQRRKGH